VIKVYVLKKNAPAFVQASKMLLLRVFVDQATSPGLIDVEFKDLDNLEQVGLVAKASGTPRSKIRVGDPASGFITPMNKVRF
jgi:hypothetical protein